MNSLKRETSPRSRLSRRLTGRLTVRLASALALIGLASRALAEVDVVAEYRFGASTAQITYTGGPETMADASGKNHELKREGNPRLLASAPSSALTSFTFSVPTGATSTGSATSIPGSGRKDWFCSSTPWPKPSTAESDSPSVTPASAIREQETDEARLCPLDRGYCVEITVTLPARGVSWYVIAGKPPHSP